MIRRSRLTFEGRTAYGPWTKPLRSIKDFARFLNRFPATATPEELRAYQLHMTDAGVTPSTFNTCIVALRFFFGMTCRREEMKRLMEFRPDPRRLPVVLSVEEVSDILIAAPGPGLKYRAALSIAHGDLNQDRELSRRAGYSVAEKPLPIGVLGAT